MDTWVRLPTKWIKDESSSSFLKSLRWTKDGTNSSNTASLMVLLAIATNTSYSESRRSPRAGVTELSFTDLSTITSLSRGVVSEGIKKLVSAGLIEKISDRKVNQYSLCGLSDKEGWGKLPAKKLYNKDFELIKAFKHFNMRLKIELDALKIYYVIVAFRSNNLNLTQVSYETICKYTGMLRNDIKPAVSLLVSTELIRVDQVESLVNKDAVINSYRLVGIDPYIHAGTSGKAGI